MERRRALALAATITAVLGSTAVAAAAVGGTSLLGFGGSGHTAQLNVLGPSGQGTSAGAGVITRTKDVYDMVTVGGSIGAAGPRSAGLVSVAQPAVPAMVVPAAPTVVMPHRFAKRHRRETGVTPSKPRPPVALAPTTTPTTKTPTTQPVSAPAPTTATTLPVTTTTRPRGVPADWPPGKPIPPMPPNCQQPQLEDNGVWNCDH